MRGRCHGINGTSDIIINKDAARCIPFRRTLLNNARPTELDCAHSSPGGRTPVARAFKPWQRCSVGFSPGRANAIFHSRHAEELPSRNVRQDWAVSRTFVRPPGENVVGRLSRVSKPWQRSHALRAEIERECPDSSAHVPRPDVQRPHRGLSYHACPSRLGNSSSTWAARSPMWSLGHPAGPFER